MKKKYEILKDDYMNAQGTILYRIRSLKKFGSVKKGELGGYIEKESNLSQEGKCWVYPGGVVLDNAKVSDDATIGNDTTICDFAKVSGNSYITNSSVYNYVQISGGAVVKNSIIEGNSVITGLASIKNSNISNYVKINCRGDIINSSIIGDAKISGGASVIDSSIYRNADIFGNTLIKNASIGLNGYMYCTNKYISIGPIGSRNDYTTFYHDSDMNIMVSCGCFNGCLKDFIKEVKKTHRHNKTYKRQYLNAIKYAKSVL